MTSSSGPRNRRTRRAIAPSQVRPATELVDERTRVLKQGDSFAVFNRRGDAIPDEGGGHGFYAAGTRHLSMLRLVVAGCTPLLLNSTVTDDNSTLHVDLTNPALRVSGQVVLPADTVHILRSKVLWEGTCYERIFVENHGIERVSLEIQLLAAADFADIFEVRGMRRAQRGALLDVEIERDRVVHAYRGLDRVVRRTTLFAEPAPARISDQGSFAFAIELAPHESTTLQVAISCESEEEGPYRPRRALLSFRDAHDHTAAGVRGGLRCACSLSSSHEELNAWLKRSYADLYMMVTETKHGLYPYAGVPWYSTVFGRDGIITALEMLWADPRIAKGVLFTLAASQATEESSEDDAEPGKILHERRDGEMAALREHAFRRYYGTVDATPLFVMLAGAYLERTDDLETVRALWPNIHAALKWLDSYGDKDGDGFIEYERKGTRGLVQQGWKDSEDSVFHDDGRLVEPPVALCEVQAYAFSAFVFGARIAAALGHIEDAPHLSERAREIQARFERQFWSDELSTYALALDRDKRRCLVRTSNAGHCLMAGIASFERAQHVVDTLMSSRMFSGWGVRTVAEGEPRYNPMSYHNGSVWPHDTAMVALGMARYGFKPAATTLFGALLDTSRAVDLARLPELFCGFVRRPMQGPTLYPVACAPQSWAAGAVLMMVEACLGLRISAPEQRVVFDRPALPPWLDWLRIKGLEVKDASIDLLLRRAGDDVAVEVEGKRGPGQVEIVVVKRV